MFFCSFAAFPNVPRKTDGLHMNRPFFRSKQDMRQTVFPRNNILHRNVFCFFSSRKEIVPPSFLFRRKEAKEKSIAEQLFFCSFAAFPNVPRKTDGLHMNRPFFRSKQDMRQTVFPRNNILHRNVFCFFSSRKEIVPPCVRNAVPFSGIDRRTQGKGCTPCRSFAFSVDYPSPRRSSGRCAGTCRRKHTYPCRT